MNPNMIAELARAISVEQSYQSLVYNLLLVAAVFLAGYLGSRINANATERGRFSAIKENFEETLSQLRQTTKVAKEMQVSMDHSDWTAREFKKIRREKIEELSFAIYSARSVLSAIASPNPDSRLLKLDESSINKVLVISSLYFPEFKENSGQLHHIHSAYVVKALDMSMPLIENEGEEKKLLAEFELKSKAAATAEDVERCREIVAEFGAILERRRGLHAEYRDTLLVVYAEFQACLLEFVSEIEKVIKDTIVPAN